MEDEDPEWINNELWGEGWRKEYTDVWEVWVDGFVDYYVFVRVGVEIVK